MHDQTSRASPIDVTKRSTTGRAALSARTTDQRQRARASECHKCELQKLCTGVYVRKSRSKRAQPLACADTSTARKFARSQYHTSDWENTNPYTQCYYGKQQFSISCDLGITTPPDLGYMFFTTHSSWMDIHIQSKPTHEDGIPTLVVCSL